MALDDVRGLRDGSNVNNDPNMESTKMEVSSELELRNTSKGISALIPKNQPDLGEVALK